MTAYFRQNVIYKTEKIQTKVTKQKNIIQTYSIITLQR